MGMMRMVMMKVAIIAVVVKLGMAANYTIGAPNGGWDTITNLQTWSASQPFYVGDNLIFQYGPNHNVVEVTKEDFEACKLSNAIAAYSDGSTIIPLSSAGNRYFVCGVPGHCTQGMKLQINVVSSSTSPIFLTPTASPSSPSLSPSPSPNPLPNSHFETKTDIMSSPVAAVGNGISPFPGFDTSPPTPSSAYEHTVGTTLPLSFSLIILMLVLPL